MAGPVLVTGQKQTGTGAGTSCNATLPASVTAGNLLVVVAANSFTTAPASNAISDTAGNTWVQVKTQANTSAVTGSIAVYVAFNAKSGSYAVTFTDAHNTVGMSISEFSPNGQSGTDGTNSATSASTTTVNPGAITTTNASDSIFAGGCNGNATTTWSAGTGYTLLGNITAATNIAVALQYQSFSTTVTSQSTAFGNTAGSGWSAAAVAIMAVAAAGGGFSWFEGIDSQSRRPEQLLVLPF